MIELPETFLQLAFVEDLIGTYRWFWSLNEVLHFLGLTLLVGIVAMYDIRLMGVAKRIPVAPLRQLLPWALFGFVLCVFSGLVFVTGLWANVKLHPLEALTIDYFLQLKLAFIAFAGLNLLFLYKSGMARATDNLGAGEEAPVLARFIAATSLFLWIGVIYWGRLVPWGI
jgi:hypothetical protein